MLGTCVYFGQLQFFFLLSRIALTRRCMCLFGRNEKKKQFLVLLKLTTILLHLQHSLIHTHTISWILCVYHDLTKQREEKKCAQCKTKCTNTNPIKSCKMNTIVGNSFALFSYCIKFVYIQFVCIFFFLSFVGR